MTSSVDTDVALNKPLPSEIDVFGLTHIGKVRSSNADHFLVASFHRAMRIHASSIRAEAFTPLSTYSRGYLFLVADGVGAFAQAADGSAHAIQSIAQYVLDMAEIGLQAQPTQEAEVAERLRTAVVQAHESLLTLGASGRAATTLTMWIGIWPRAFIIHAGDSRCYRLRGGVLERLTTDQTMAQAMIEAGAIRSDSAEASRLKHILISALGSSQMDLQVIMTDTERTDVMLLCSDGLTKHVSDEEIRERLASGAGAVSICSQLVDLALARGGEDNVTVIVGRARS